MRHAIRHAPSFALQARRQLNSGTHPDCDWHPPAQSQHWATRQDRHATETSNPAPHPPAPEEVVDDSAEEDEEALAVAPKAVPP